MSNNKFDFPFNKQNLYIIFIGLAINIIGYLLMIGGGTEDPNKFDAKELFSETRITLAPIFIVLGFAIMIYGIMKRASKSKSEE